MLAQGLVRCGHDVAGAAHRLGKAFGGAVHGVDVVVAVVEEVAHLFPGRGAGAGLLAPQRLVEAGQPLVRLPVGAVQVEEGVRQRGRVRRGQPQVGQRRRGIAEDGVGQRLAHVAHHPFAVAGRQLGHVDAEFLRQGQHHRGRDRAVVLLHLVQVGQRDAQLGGEVLLRQLQPQPDLSQLRPGVEFLDRHGPDLRGFAFRSD